MRHQRQLPDDSWLTTDDRRSHARFQVQQLGALLESDVFLDPVQLINIARRGFSARTIITYVPGTRLMLHIDALAPIRCVVAWGSKGQVGGRFETPLPQGHLLSLSGTD